MRPIPIELREQMAKDPWYHACCIGPKYCKGKIEWHHVWIYAGKQINEIWAIIPLCHFHHEKAGLHPFKERYELISLNSASLEDLSKYPKKDWKQYHKYLIKYLKLDEK